ncbi:MAG: hypothetical protein EBV86_13915, partial [Marivivens sp.]|nr:hypothetical protein [Marivivens sp.]
WAEEYDGETVTPWDVWIKKVERLVGFNLDGNEARDGYSLDGAFEMFERGMSVRDAAASIAAQALGGESR